MYVPKLAPCLEDRVAEVQSGDGVDFRPPQVEHVRPREVDPLAHRGRKPAQVVEVGPSQRRRVEVDAQGDVPLVEPNELAAEKRRSAEVLAEDPERTTDLLLEVAGEEPGVAFRRLDALLIEDVLVHRSCRSVSVSTMTRPSARAEESFSLMHGVGLAQA